MEFKTKLNCSRTCITKCINWCRSSQSILFTEKKLYMDNNQIEDISILDDEIFSSYDEDLMKNFATLADAVIKAKPAACKGQYVKSCVVASTMGPGIKINQGKIG